MTLSTQAAKRRGSVLEVLNNPLEQFSNTPGSSTSNGNNIPIHDNHEIKIENLVDTVKIENEELTEIINSLQRVSDNTTRIRILHTMKVPYLFTSSDLLKLLEVTASVKTRIAFINEIGPRLIDPKAKSAEIIDLFRYVDDRTQVEEVLKARAVTVAKMSSFQSSKPLIGGRGTIGGRGGSVCGGRGRGSRISGRGIARPSQVQNSSKDEVPPAPKVSVINAVIPANSSLTPHVSESSRSENGDLATPTDQLTSDHNQSLPEINHQVQGRRASIRPSLKMPSQRICSRIGVTNSVVKTLGLSGVDVISLEGVPLESWEVKARNQSIVAETLLSEEDKRRMQLAEEVKSSLNSELGSLSTKSHVPETTSQEAGDNPSIIQSLARRFSFRNEALPAPEPSPLPSEVDEEGVIGWVKRRLSFKGNPEDTVPPSTLPQPFHSAAETEESILSSTGEMNAMETNSPEGVVDWIKRRFSFQADSEPRSSLPPTNRSVSEPPIMRQEISQENIESESVVGWVKRRLSFRKEEDLLVPPPSTLPQNSVAKIFSSDFNETKDAVEKTTPSELSLSPAKSSHQSHTDEELISQKKERKTLFGWLTRKNSTDNSAMDSTWHPTSSNEVPRSKRSMSNSSSHGEELGRKSQSRPSVRKIHESQKVGFVRSFFEGLTGKKESLSQESDNPQNNSQSINSLIQSNETSEIYSLMNPESSLGFHPETGRILYSYHELVRQNYLKEYSADVDSQTLEEHLSDGEFLLRFNMTREEFHKLPQWRKTERKKNLKLF